ncbi:MAG: type II toxin-antitoxin system VapB family antitoxin [Cyanobacteria bacterium P01_A01_bin.83]
MPKFDSAIAVSGFLVYNVYIITCVTHKMRTNIDLDDHLVERAFALTGLRTKKELINFALAELVKRSEKKDLFDLAGDIEFVEDFDTDVVRNNRYVID